MTELKRLIEKLDLISVKENYEKAKQDGQNLELFRINLDRTVRFQALNLANSNCSLVQANEFVRFVIEMAQQELCMKGLTIQVLQDIFDVSVIKRCEELFSIVEDNIAVEEKMEETEENDIEIGEIRDGKDNLDYGLYSKFWEVQSFFSNPNSLYDSSVFKKFESILNDILNVFALNKLERPNKNLKSSKYKKERSNSKSPDIPQYFKVEIKTEVQETLNGTINGTSNGFEPSTYTNGKVEEENEFFAKYLTNQKRILNREKSWQIWKADGCPDLVSALTKEECVPFKIRPVHKYNPKVLDLGNKELTRLWSINPDNLAAYLKKFLEEGLDELDPEQQVEEAYKSVNDEKYQWMASRYLLYNSEHYMNCVNYNENKPAREPTGKYLEKAIQMTAVNIPELKERVEKIHDSLRKIEDSKRKIEEEKKKIEREKKKAEEEKKKLEDEKKKKKLEEERKKLEDEKKKLEEQKKKLEEEKKRKKLEEEKKKLDEEKKKLEEQKKKLEEEKKKRKLEEEKKKKEPKKRKL